MIAKLKSLKSGQIKKVIAGGGNGSIILFDIEVKSEKYVLYIYCTWRLSKKNKVITGSNDSTEVFASELNMLTNTVISEVKISEIGDFFLDFKEFRLDVFCDLTPDINEDGDRENWTLCNTTKNECVSLTNNFKLFTESYN